MPYSKVTGLGFYVPETVVTNADLAAQMDTSDEWIIERTGIHERRFFKEGVDTVSNMGAKAARIAMERAGCKPEEIDMVVFATLSPDYYFPGCGVLVQRELGLRQIPCFDIRQQCGGFVYALSLADQYIRTGFAKKVLVIGSEIQSNVMEISDRGRNMAVIFGDGAGALLLEAHDKAGKGILSTHLHSDGTHAEELMVEHIGSKRKQRITHDMLDDGSLLPYMNGKMVFQHAVRYFPEVIREALTANNLKESDIDIFVPHQANARITQAVQKELGLRDDQVVSNIHKYGNTTAGSIPIALTEAWEEGRIKEGDLVCLAAFGSGFMWASTLIRW
ncbi:MAG: ketoacyl-ACP synthase III [Bacteroidetes bacterium]|nr:ketoacyl-ACP synthase III [Bacteroidota bacterium]MBS1685284.1 ketoacyl-ACP synthase III [Bacteroidota bacterium]